MKNFHNPIQHLKYLRQSLSQDNESIGFFISAGCPLSVEMSDPKDWPLIADIAGLSRSINNELQTNKEYMVLQTELIKAGKDKDNIEDVLSFIRSLTLVSRGGKVRGLTEDDLLNLDSIICSTIVKKIDVKLPDEETPYHRLSNWVRSIDRKVAVEIFTTNYDLLMEQALEDLEIPYFDGFVGSRRSFFDLRAVEDDLIPTHWSRLWKIHGSINWYQEKIKDENKVYRSSEIKSGATHLIYPSHLKYEESRKMPYLALIDQLNRFIRKKSSLLILSGYSFNDNHLNDTIMNALKANPTAMVLGLQFGSYEVEIEHDKGVKRRIERYPQAYKFAQKQHNLNIWTFDKAIIGTKLGKWFSLKEDGEDLDILKFISKDEVVGDPTKMEHLVKIGDFSLFTNFLKQIIGTSKDI